MEQTYEPGLGVYIGTFSLKDIKDGADAKAIQIAKQETGFAHVIAKPVRTGLQIYMCEKHDAQNYYTSIKEKER